MLLPNGQQTVRLINKHLYLKHDKSKVFPEMQNYFLTRAQEPNTRNRQQTIYYVKQQTHVSKFPIMRLIIRYF